MFKENLEFLIKVLGNDGFTQEESIKLVYFFRAWRVLSNNEVTDKRFRFEHSRKELNIRDLDYVFRELSEEFYLFEAFDKSVKIDKLSEKSFLLIIEFVFQERTFLKLYDVFVDMLGKYGRDYYISNQVAELGVKLLNTNYSELYAPFSNSFNVAYYTEKKIFAESHADELIIEIIKILDDVDIEFNRTDILDKPSFIEGDRLKGFDCTVSFPPIGAKSISSSFKDDIYNRFRIYQGKGSLDVAHFEHILAQTRRKAVVLMATGVTFRGGVEEKFREYLMGNNWLEAIVQLPSNLLIGTGVQTTFFVINKKKNHNNVYFMNLEDKQFIEKKGRQLVLNKIDKIIEMYKEKKEVENIASVVPSFQIIENNYSLSINRYIFSKEDIRISKILDNYSSQSVQEIATVRKSQLIEDELEGTPTYEISPSDFNTFGFTLECGRVKKIKQQHSKYLTYRLFPNDILVSTKGTIGKVALIGDIKAPMIASQAIQVIRLNVPHIIEPKYLYMFLKSNIGQSLLKKLSTGTTMPQITTKEIKELKVPIPSRKEQEKAMQNFEEEVLLYKEVECLKEKINNINTNFLGDLDHE
ncbi:MAG: Unknown protein [uncultured Sulfurovum sp.]|uniref:site-specific DNA-methyltransferase (adenine-specific) n=1 Tax=uncultured Sulfurovum sp. TaxID=269237 RepID=A0A6S6SL71_9BACT|nr:MAG: Unknown protein [uncultured Sulfurovum sp.]